MKKKGLIVLIIAICLVITGMGIYKKLFWKIEADWNTFSETAEYLANRERGFYSIRGVKISDDKQIESWVYDDIRNSADHTDMELLQIHIGAYKNDRISDKGLKQIRSILDAYKESGRTLIVRVLYDWDGKGMESDPESLNLVLEHMEQIGSVLEAYEDRIYIVQGVFVGSWGEMHSSRYLTGDAYMKLIRQMDRCMPESIFLAVRTPAYWRTAAGTKNPFDSSGDSDCSGLAGRLSLFNDGILGNSLDCGTYGDLEKEEALNNTDKWIREDELDFQQQLNLYTPNGGEVVLDNPLNDFENADAAFRKMHISYLNRDHDEAVLNKWKHTIYRNSASCYDGMTAYDYIERHLGYRFVVRNVSITERGLNSKKPQLTIAVENVGYGNRYTECDVEVLCKNIQNGKVEHLIPDTDVRKWNPETETVFQVQPDISQGGVYEVYLKVTGKKDRSCILFANKDIITEKGFCYLGRIKAER